MRFYNRPTKQHTSWVKGETAKRRRSSP